jgi:hypothetical protein
VDLPGPIEKRFDIVFVVNGLPLVIGEAKSPARSAVTWFDGAYRVSEIYEKQVPAIFVPNVFSFATEGRVYRYGSIRMPIDLWGPWRTEENEPEGTLADVSRSVESMLQPEVVLDLLQYYTLFATDKKHRRIKIIARYQQFVTANQIVDRVVRGYPKKGLIWHFQGSGKSLLMVFAAQKLRLHPGLGNPTVMIVVDRIDLDTQITATFNAADVPNMVSVATRQELQTLLAHDVRKVLITIIHKFAEADGDLNERSNIIVLVDEAHRTQEGDLGRKMREALPNAFLFGLTGTPINRADRNTFWAFGADEDEKGYMSRYSFQESIRDRATLPLHFETPEVKLQIDRAAIDEAYQAMYLDKPMKDHNLLQAICRTNRTFGQKKTHGLIVDYIGIFDDVAHALDFDEKTVQQVITNIDDLRRELPIRVQKCLTFFPGVDRTRGGYEGLMEAQQCLPDNEARDGFAAEYSVLGTIWEALSPDPVLGPYENDFRWITQVYESVRPPSGHGRLLWHALGAKTVDLINKNVHVQSVRDDVETLVLDAQVLAGVPGDADPEKKAREIEIKLIARLRRHAANPAFIALGERLEKVRDRHEQGFLTSLEFLKAILEVAKDVVEAERETDPEEERDRAREALTELFNEAKNKATYIIVERIVTDIGDIVKKVRFPDWQHTSQGERLVQKELRRTLLKYKLHTDQELFDRAYAYIRQYC